MLVGEWIKYRRLSQKERRSVSSEVKRQNLRLTEEKWMLLGRADREEREEKSGRESVS